MNSLPSLPSIEVLASEQSQPNDYITGNTVYTYVDGTGQVDTEQLPYFTTTTDNTLNTVITECFGTDDPKEQTSDILQLESRQKKTPKKKIDRKLPKYTRKPASIEDPLSVRHSPYGSSFKSEDGIGIFRNPLKSPINDRIRSRHTWGSSSPTSLYDQNFGSGICPDAYACSSSSLYMRGRRGPREYSGISVIRRKVESFAFLLEVHDFQSEELQVRVSMAGRILEVEAKHDMREDEFGTVERHFKRKYRLPDNAMLEKTTSSHSEQGVLTIVIPRKVYTNGTAESSCSLSADDLSLIDDYIPKKSPLLMRQRLMRLGDRRVNEQVLIDVPQFHANELKVRVCGSELEVEARHEEREDDHGRIERYFRRKYNIPKSVQMDKNFQISSTLTEEGVLIVYMFKRVLANRPPLSFQMP